MNDPKHIAGIGGLIPTDDPSISSDIIKLEQDIIRGAKIATQTDDIDAAREYNDEMSRLTSNFMQDHSEEPQQSQSIQSSNNREEHSIDFSNIDDQSSIQPSSHSNKETDIFVPKDPHMKRATLEEQKQKHIHAVLNDIEDNELGIDVDKDRDEDEKSSLLEQIDILRDTLDDDGINISGVPLVSKSNSLSDIRNVHKMLRLKNDRNRYCTFAEEIILAFAHGAEYLFDGEKEWFGRKPDLVGWPETVKVKLRRMRYDTSSLVQEIMQDYSFSPSVRLMIELIPSMFLYSRNRRKTLDDTIVSDGPIKKNDNQYNEAISNLNSLSAS